VAPEVPGGESSYARVRKVIRDLRCASDCVA